MSFAKIYSQAGHGCRFAIIFACTVCVNVNVSVAILHEIIFPVTCHFHDVFGECDCLFFIDFGLFLWHGSTGAFTWWSFRCGRQLCQATRLFQSESFKILKALEWIGWGHLPVTTRYCPGFERIPRPHHSIWIFWIPAPWILSLEPHIQTWNGKWVDGNGFKFYWRCMHWPCFEYAGGSAAGHSIEWHILQWSQAATQKYHKCVVDRQIKMEFPEQ